VLSSDALHSFQSQILRRLHLLPLPPSTCMRPPCALPIIRAARPGATARHHLEVTFQFPCFQYSQASLNPLDLIERSPKLALLRLLGGFDLDPLPRFLLLPRPLPLLGSAARTALFLSWPDCLVMRVPSDIPGSTGNTSRGAWNGEANERPGVRATRTQGRKTVPTALVSSKPKIQCPL
jgi:hypothetical protein